MKPIRLYILLTALFLGAQVSIAQPPPPNCPPSYSTGYDIIGDSVSFCLDGVNLQVSAYSSLHSTDSYSVNNITYNPYPWVGANQILVNTDDIWSGVINLPFPFCFFGQKYNSVVIGANGQVGFDAATQAGAFNAWASSGFVAPNNNAAMNNTIMTPYHDVNPAVAYAGKNITWDIYGTAPCRYMVVSWDSVPMFSCSTLLASQQVVLFESTYLMDINIKQKPLCSSWNGGVAHEGIQNANGTVAFMVPGRNGTQWTATNDSYRFTPSGTINVNYQYWWIDIPTGDTLGTGPTLSYFPTQSSQVTVACYAVTDCDTIQAFYGDTVNVIVTGNVTADFSADIHLGCDEDTVIFKNLSSSTAGGTPSYLWSFGDGSISTSFDTTHIYASQGIFPVILIASDNGCYDTIVKPIDLLHPINADFKVSDGTHVDSTCLGLPLIFNASGFSTPGIGFLTYTWDFGDGSAPTTVSTDPTNYTYLNPGVYNVKLTVTDTLGCIDTFSHSVFVDNPPFVDFSVSDDKVCVGQPVFFTDTVAPFTVSFEWDFKDGKKLRDVHNPKHTWDIAGTYDVTLTGEYKICPDMTVTKTIIVDAYPNVNIGPDTMMCPGLTGSITLTDNSSASSHLWSTGETNSSIIVTEPGRYWVEGKSGECSTTDSIWIKRDCYLNIPNSFSPNGDGLNDYFLPRELLSSGLTSFTMSIYNRWGEKIFATDKIDGRGWDGKFNGVNQPQGVYVYVIDAIFRNNMKKNFTGNVTLMR